MILSFRGFETSRKRSASPFANGYSIPHDPSSTESRWTPSIKTRITNVITIDGTPVYHKLTDLKTTSVQSPAIFAVKALP
jgi:hypothetical protein